MRLSQRSQVFTNLTLLVTNPAKTKRERNDEVFFMNLAGVERIQEALDGCTNSSRFLILYGAGIEDMFLARNYNPLTFGQALHQALQHNGFGRIAFWAPHRPVFFMDNPSEAASLPPPPPPSAARPRC
jgi:hypothetical protein